MKNDMQHRRNMLGIEVVELERLRVALKTHPEFKKWLTPMIVSCEVRIREIRRACFEI